MNPKVAFITGSARRLGASIAECLHTAGYNVVIHYRESLEEAEILAASFNAKRPHSAVTVCANLNQTQALPKLLEETVASWGRLDVLVNNASRFLKSPIGEIDETVWDDLLASNLKAPYFLSQLAYPHLVKTSGSIINLTDTHIEHPFRHYAVYCISKAGLAHMTRALAKEFGPNVRVNAVSPGLIKWPEGENELTADQKEKIIQATILKRIGDPSDIAKTVLFLARDADFMTGQIIAVDGGRL